MKYVLQYYDCYRREWRVRLIFDMTEAESLDPFYCQSVSVWELGNNVSPVKRGI